MTRVNPRLVPRIRSPSAKYHSPRYVAVIRARQCLTRVTSESLHCTSTRGTANGARSDGRQRSRDRLSRGQTSKYRTPPHSALTAHQFVDLEAVHTFEGSYDVNTLYVLALFGNVVNTDRSRRITAREITGQSAFKKWSINSSTCNIYPYRY